MFKLITQGLLLISTLLFALQSLAFELDATQINGIHVLAVPERSPAGQTQKLEVEFGEMNGQKMLATRACQRCPAAAYNYLSDESAELQRPVFFNSMGIYVIAYDANTLVSVMADGQLGKKPWSKIVYANVYSKQGTPSISLDQGKQFVLAESKRLMTGEGVADFAVTGGNGTYYAAMRHTVGSKTYDQMKVEIKTGKSIRLEGMNCRHCSSDNYVYQAELSKAIGKPVYEKGHMGRFLIEQDKGVLWWTNAHLGKQIWGKKDKFNVIAQDKTAVRKLTQDKAAQNKIDAVMKNHAQKAKAAVDARYAREDQQRTANNQLPAQGMKDATLNKDALIAAKAWASSYRWKEKLQSVYMTSRDWSILRNKLTGLQTGRQIYGVITMKRPDGLCSYQPAVFEQAYNGSGYQKTVMTGVVPGQNKLDCSKI